MLVSCLVKGLDQTSHWKGQMVAALEGAVWVLSYDKSSELEEWWAAALRWVRDQMTAKMWNQREHGVVRHLYPFRDRWVGNSLSVWMEWRVYAGQEAIIILTPSCSACGTFHQTASHSQRSNVAVQRWSRKSWIQPPLTTDVNSANVWSTAGKINLVISVITEGFYTHTHMPPLFFFVVMEFPNVSHQLYYNLEWLRPGYT